MSDPISGIKNVNPTYPVKPVQPAERDRESGKRKKDAPRPESTDNESTEDKPVIDEYI